MTDLFVRPLFTWRSVVASKHGPGNPTTRHVLLTLGLYMSEKGDSCFPATRTLADCTGLSQRAVVEHLKTAAAAGWIGKKERQMRGGKGWRRMEYFAIIPSAAEAGYRGEPPSPPHGDDRRSPASGDDRPSPPPVDKSASGDDRPSIGDDPDDIIVSTQGTLITSVNSSIKEVPQPPVDKSESKPLRSLAVQEYRAQKERKAQARAASEAKERERLAIDPQTAETS